MISAPVAWWISSAAAVNVASVRAHSASRAPSLASPIATAFPRPWLEAATMATRSLSPRSIASAPQVRVVLLEPVFTDGAEDVEIECVFERHCTVRHVGGDAQHLALTHHDRLAA